ncbi:MAG: DegT/DnrJ/EryC1/StrS family aminotransferase [Actinobacteria bacterium]|nr:DegT/DnrJ/EryC1/StrS family aminotransferase [Actinomycetota bacterium]
MRRCGPSGGGYSTAPVGVPLFASSLERYHDRIVERLAEVTRSGRYILGPEVSAFEDELAAYLGVRHCVGVANGTDALTIALRALGVEPGDEVVLPSFTFYATAEAAVNAGAVPVFCDVDRDTACVTGESVERAITPRTRAIVPVHLFGNVAPVEEIASLGLPVLEDAAQAAGALRGGRRAGALGDAATFSFFPSKNLPCLGDGGAIATNSDDVADRARRLRFHGSADKETFDQVGYNSRLDELQAAALRVLLPELDRWTEARRTAAAAYETQGLGEVAGLALPRPVPGSEPAYHLYVARHERPDALAGALAERGVGARGYYRLPVHLQPSMLRFGGESLELPATDELARTNLALPMGTGLEDTAIAEVVAACEAAAAATPVG